MGAVLEEAAQLLGACEVRTRDRNTPEPPAALFLFWVYKLLPSLLQEREDVTKNNEYKEIKILPFVVPKLWSWGLEMRAQNLEFSVIQEKPVLYS